MTQSRLTQIEPGSDITILILDNIIKMLLYGALEEYHTIARNITMSKMTSLKGKKSKCREECFQIAEQTWNEGDTLLLYCDDQPE